MAKLSRKRAEAVAIFGLCLQLVFAGVVLGIAAWSKAISCMVVSWQFILGVPFWLMVLLQLYQQRRAEEEAAAFARVETERRAGRGTRGALFEESEAEAFAAKTRVEHLERYFVPGISVLLGAALGFLAFYLIRNMLKEVLVPGINNASLSAAMMVGVAFVSFLIAKYASGMARQKMWGLLRTGASYLMFCAVGSGLVAGGLALAHAEIPAVERMVGLFISGLMGLIALEIILNFVLDFYRPRAKEEYGRPAYDSRILGLLVEPSGIFRTVAATLDYQFGFRISQTWFYQFLERAIAPLILFWIITFYLLTCIVIIGPEERAVVERFGRPRTEMEPLGPGIHLKWPWPVEKLLRLQPKRIMEMEIGHKGRKSGEYQGWEKSPYEQEFKFMVATEVTEAEKKTKETVPVKLMCANFNIYYQIDESRLYDYLYEHSDPTALLEAIAYREVTRYISGADIDRVIGPGREEMAEALKNDIQEEADKIRLGIHIASVQPQEIHIPFEEELAKTYEKIASSKIDKKVKVTDAEAFRIQTEAKAEYEREAMLSEAYAYKYQRVVAAEAAANRFESQLKAFQASPRVYMLREYLSALEEGLAGIRKYVIAVDAAEWNIDIDMSEMLSPGIIDVDFGIEEERGKKKEAWQESEERKP